MFFFFFFCCCISDVFFFLFLLLCGVQVVDHGINGETQVIGR
ncbi:hypothetical protein M6B38_113090 [Iris pallida]|uniref:Uncharacterized protein n=1 Tax=Iris pallida TaxID=29817 RepID=A0AAX6ILI6_IRIPA|nr:hypothetical protein M6B38_113090 [Iris pallida]